MNAIIPLVSALIALIIADLLTAANVLLLHAGAEAWALPPGTWMRLGMDLLLMALILTLAWICAVKYRMPRGVGAAFLVVGLGLPVFATPLLRLLVTIPGAYPSEPFSLWVISPLMPESFTVFTLFAIALLGLHALLRRRAA